MENNRIDDAILATVIYGRIEPKIYAFETATIPNYLKVGDTFRTVEERLNEWRNAGFKDLSPVGDWSAEIEGKDVYFRDYAVHEYLEPNHERLTRDSFPDKPYSREFFKNASKADVEDAICDIITAFDNGGANYAYYGIKERTAKEAVYPRDPFNWEPRKPLQTDAIAKFEAALQSNRESLLMYAVMRFGKSFTSLCCAKAMNAKFVLIVSGKADVADEWKENVQRPGQFENFVFLNTKSLKKNDKAITDAQRDNKCIVLFLTLQDLSKEKKRFEELFKTQIDLMIIDETHFGARADTLGKVIADAHYKTDTYLKEIEKTDGIKNEALGSLQRDKAEKELKKVTKGLSVKVKLHLSGTPYRILMGSEFGKDDVISFCQYSDVIAEKEKWYNDNIADGRQAVTRKEEWDNPYYGFPQMVRFAFNLNKSSMDRIKQLEEQGYTYRLSALFAPRSVEKDDGKEYRKFVYESEVLDFLYAIDGTQKDQNLLSFLDNQRIKDGKLCRHIVMVLPYCASCDAMETLIKEHMSDFINLSEYEIINISGIDSKYNKISEVKSKIRSCESEDKKTITLTVNRMLTGCTVPEWDTMIFLKDTASPQDYDQAIFRLQSQYVVEYESTKIVDGKEEKKTLKKDMKPQTLLVDFNPQRMFYLQETKSRIYNINTEDGGNEESEKRIERDLEVSPIIHISENKLVEVKPIDILKAVSEYSVNRGITEAANDIIVDTNLINVESIKKIIDKEFEISSGKGLAQQTYTGDGTDLDDDDIKTGGETSNKKDNNAGHQGQEGTDAETSEEGTEKKVFIKKCRSYYRRILFYSFLCKSEDEIKNLNEVLRSVDTPENERIFKHLGMNKDFLELLKENMSGGALRSLDEKIFDLYRLSHEYDDADEDPIKRAVTAMKSFGKISDSEVVTPQHIATEMVDQIPEEDFKKVFVGDGKILDIASKMGEFATAVYRRAVSLEIPEEKVQNRIYSIPTSKLAYEFTRFVYEKLGLRINNIAYHFTSYDLLDIKPIYKKRKKVGQPSKEIDYKKIKALITQKKPFDEIKLSDTVAEGEEKVKFNVVVGNPPYQDKKRSNSPRDLPIYDKFMSEAYELADRVMLITPARFLFNAGFTPGKWNRKMLNDEHLKVVFFEAKSQNVFSNTQIPGGVAITYRDSTVVFGRIGKFIPYPELVSIMKKCKSDKVMTDLISSRDLFHYSDLFFESFPEKRKINNNNNVVNSNAFEKFEDVYTEKPTRDDDICFLGRYHNKRQNRYILKEYIEFNPYISQCKVVFAQTNGGAGTITEEKAAAVMGKPTVYYELSGFTDSFICVGLGRDKVAADNCAKYIRTKFMRALLATLKRTGSITKDKWANVPVQDFTPNSDIDWSQSIADIDRQLYAKYGLDENEIEFIEAHVKEM